jgi:hypothetical protein
VLDERLRVLTGHLLTAKLYGAHQTALEGGFMLLEIHGDSFVGYALE